MSLFLFDNQCRMQGHAVIAGVDEAGRGPWAGPVVAAAVVLPQGADIPGLNDSKKLTALQREKLFLRIKEIALGIGVETVDQLVIDSINILQATHRAMRGALTKITLPINLVLVDGLPVPDLGFPHKAITGGDGKSACIAAASIVAKVTRDALMCELSLKYPQYNFQKHKGYGTPDHQQALKLYGPCPLHRKSFAPVRDCLSGDALSDDTFNKRELGSRGEDRGEAFLRKNGYSVIERNYRTCHGEIDIIARDGPDIVFVEVKLRRTGGYGLPQEAVDAKKQKKIIRSALQYAKAKNLLNENLRFDVLSLGPEPGHIEHIKHAFHAPEQYFY